MVIEISENNIKKPSIVALIPARSGSLRVPGKNIRYILGHPLIAYTITAALNSGIFSKVIVSTDSTEYSEIAMYYGAEVPFLRPESISGAYSPDIEFVEHAISELNQPWHSSQYQTLPEIYVQNASLEIAWTKVVNETRTIAGNTIIPFLTVDDEGLDINGEYDWKVVTTMLEGGQAILPVIDVEPYMKA
jgi:CMP-N-acetylneuraminic acid synthetase